MVTSLSLAVKLFPELFFGVETVLWRHVAFPSKIILTIFIIILHHVSQEYLFYGAVYCE